MGWCKYGDGHEAPDSEFIPKDGKGAGRRYWCRPHRNNVGVGLQVYVFREANTQLPYIGNGARTRKSHHKKFGRYSDTSLFVSVEVPSKAIAERAESLAIAMAFYDLEYNLANRNLPLTKSLVHEDEVVARAAARAIIEAIESGRIDLPKES